MTLKDLLESSNPYEWSPVEKDGIRQLFLCENSNLRRWCRNYVLRHKQNRRIYIMTSYFQYESTMENLRHLQQNTPSFILILEDVPFSLGKLELGRWGEDAFGKLLRQFSKHLIRHFLLFRTFKGQAQWTIFVSKLDWNCVKINIPHEKSPSASLLHPQFTIKNDHPSARGFPIVTPYHPIVARF